MIFHVLTLFPEVFEPYISTSIIGRGLREGHIHVNFINFRDFSTNKHKKVDDTAFGGGPGMVLQREPLFRAIQSIYSPEKKLVFLTPVGKLYNQRVAKELVNEQEIILVSGHYEGFDERIFKLFNHEKISIGDYVLTGGELPALVIIDSVARLYQEVLHNKESLTEESFNDGLLEYDQYTKPRVYQNLQVPDILLSGHHKNIAFWRKKSSIYNTLTYRPELIENNLFNDQELDILSNFFEEKDHDNE